jgi:hypothetical protein
MSVIDAPMARAAAARAELAGAQLRQSASATLMQIASVRWRGVAARAFDDDLTCLLILVRGAADDLDTFADTVRRALARDAVRR